MTTPFSALALVEPLQRALREEGYDLPTPIQASAIPPLLEGRDIVGIAQTGTGKTAAFALPILQRLAAERPPRAKLGPRALILTPTRELAIQIGESFRAYGRHLHLRQAVIFGGVGQGPQVAALRRGLDLAIATPGRLLDLLQQRHLRLDEVSIFVLDEADRMLDMGFIRDVRKIAAQLPRERQTMLFSATMPSEIDQLAATLLREPVRVQATPPATTVARVEQRVMFVPMPAKRALLASILEPAHVTRALVFTRTKHGADRVSRDLQTGRVAAEAIHGNKSQSARQRALEGFRAGRVRVLVATDIAARGIDVDGVSHVINYDLPHEPESYVHRIGRTGRAGAGGIAISFCAPEERSMLADIERITKRRLEVAEVDPAIARTRSPTTHEQRQPRRERGSGARPPQNGHRGAGNGQRSSQGKSHNGGQGRSFAPARQQRQARRAG
jgi:ATP-dependent RNA helicase RhlE